MTFIYTPDPQRHEKPVDPKRCAASVWDNWTNYQCRRKGILEHQGRLWCKQHHPPTYDAKRRAKQAKWEALDREIEQKARDAEDIPKFRALAKRAAELVARLEEDGVSTFGVVHDLAAMHRKK